MLRRGGARFVWCRASRFAVAGGRVRLGCSRVRRAVLRCVVRGVVWCRVGARAWRVAACWAVVGCCSRRAGRWSGAVRGVMGGAASCGAWVRVVPGESLCVGGCSGAARLSRFGKWSCVVRCAVCWGPRAMLHEPSCRARLAVRRQSAALLFRARNVVLRRVTRVDVVLGRCRAKRISECSGPAPRSGAWQPLSPVVGRMRGSTRRSLAAEASRPVFTAASLKGVASRASVGATSLLRR